MNVGKTIEPDGMENKIIKTLQDAVVSTSNKMFDATVNTGKIQKQWTIGEIILRYAKEKEGYRKL